MRIAILSFFLFLLTACTSVKLSVPPQFSSQATQMPVKGLNGWMVAQHLSFGPYQTSKVKRGWDFQASVQYTKFRMSPEEYLLKVFDINTDKGNNYQRNRFQYTLTEGALETEIYATEKFSEKQLVYKSNNPYVGNASKTTRYEYGFTAAVVPLAQKAEDPWSLVLINKYDIKKDTDRGLMDRPYVEEEGYATNGKENIAIRPLRLDNVTTASGRQTKVLGGKMLSGYELRWDNGVVGIIDILDNTIWIVDNLEPKEKIIVASIASAILLKRMQDVEKDKDSFDQ